VKEIAKSDISHHIRALFLHVHPHCLDAIDQVVCNSKARFEDHVPCSLVFMDMFVTQSTNLN
jgi:hypothetical protein